MTELREAADVEELILPQLEGHLQAAEAKARAQLSAAEAFVSSGGWVSHLVLAELTWVLSSVYELTQHQIATVVEMLVDWTRRRILRRHCAC